MNVDSKIKIEHDNSRLINYFKGPLNNVSLKGYELSIKSVKLFQILNSNVDSNLVTIGRNIELKSLIKEVIIEENSSNNQSLLGRVISINYLPKDLIENIEKSEDYDMVVEDLIKSPVEFFGYM